MSGTSRLVDMDTGVSLKGHGPDNKTLWVGLPRLAICPIHGPLSSPDKVTGPGHTSWETKDLNFLSATDSL